MARSRCAAGGGSGEGKRGGGGGGGGVLEFIDTFFGPARLYK